MKKSNISTIITVIIVLIAVTLDILILIDLIPTNLETRLLLFVIHIIVIFNIYITLMAKIEEYTKNKQL